MLIKIYEIPKSNGTICKDLYVIHKRSNAACFNTVSYTAVRSVEHDDNTVSVQSKHGRSAVFHLRP